VTGDYSVYSRKGGVDLYLHTFVLWASDWGWIEQTLNSRQSPLETEVFLSLSLSLSLHKCFFKKILHILEDDASRYIKDIIV
jgi:hypothetical protein